MTSLSPFVLAEKIDPALPLISGVVVNQNGEPLVGVLVAIAGDRVAEVNSDLDGRFAFPNLSATGNYIVSAAKSGYGFNPDVMNLTSLGAGTDILFVGTNAPPAPVPPLAIAPGARFGNQPTITWPGFLEQFTLESTGSLNPANWSIAPELQLPTGPGVAVPLAPAQAERYYRLKR